MKRDPRLHGLSSEHHQALVLARRIRRAFQAGGADHDLVQIVGDRFEAELRPHFEVEERLLLPALEAAGGAALAAHTRADHAALRSLLEAALAGRLEALEAFGARLDAHVRFEEQTLFPACEDRLDGAVLDEVARQAPRQPA